MIRIATKLAIATHFVSLGLTLALSTCSDDAAPGSRVWRGCQFAE